MDQSVILTYSIILLTVMQSVLAVSDGICYETKKENRTKIVLQRKSFIDFVYVVCSTGFCGKSKINFKEEFVPIDYTEEVRTPYCCPGYSNTSSFTNVTSVVSKGYGKLGCDPVCNPKCVNGTCVAPNVCTCPSRMNLQYDKRTCKYECDPSCENGECVGHNTCICHERYSATVDEPHICLPECTVPCINAYCMLPNVCRCLDGYKKNPFKINECLPVCTPSCINGLCVGANKCECDAGYKTHAVVKSMCEPVCESCTNGVCVFPNECECNPGYEKPIQSSFSNSSSYSNSVCEPVCGNGCIGGICIAPNKCECFEGFIKDPQNDILCRPACEPACINGICTGPNKCTCDIGYENSKEKDELCVPNCKNCNNDTGFCVAPDACMCRLGYTRNKQDTECEPECMPPCFNANCTKPNHCECLDGFYKPANNEGATHICDSKVKRCKKSINNNIRKLTNDTSVEDSAGKGLCFEFDGVLKSYDELCQIEFTNNTCYDDHCVVNNDSICHEMVYTCDLWPDLLSPSTVAAVCSWNYREDFVVEEHSDRRDHYKVNVETTEISSKSTEMNFELNIDSSFDRTEKQSLNNAQAFQSLYFFRQDFDKNPCLLCLCPVDDHRHVCIHEQIHLRLCQCPKENDMRIMQGVSKQSHLIIVTTVFTLLLVSIGALLYVARRKYRTYRKNKTAYRVSAFSNDIYCEGPVQDTGHIYSEILNSRDD